MTAPTSEQGALAQSGFAPVGTHLVSLDRALAIVVALAVLVLFLAPTRILFIPFEYGGEYVMFLPPNIIDVMWIGIGLALYARAGMPTARIALGLAAMVIIGFIGLVVAGEMTPDHFADLLIFNTRAAGALAIGAMLARTGLGGETVPLIYLAGGLSIAVSSLVLALGGGSYDYYSELRRFGSLGMTPNETGTVLAGAFNMLPWLTRDRRWLALATPVLVIGVLLTGSRTGLLLIMAGALFWVPSLIGRVRGFRAVLAWISILTVAALATWVAWGVLRSFASREVVASVTARARDTGTDESSTFRLTIYLDTLRFLWEHPAALLVGVGGSNVAVEWLLVKVLPLDTYHAHNLLLQAWAAYGIAGLAACVVLLKPLFRRSSRFPDNGALAMRACALTIALGQALQYGLGEQKFLLLFAIAVGYTATASANPGVSLGPAA